MAQFTYSIALDDSSGYAWEEAFLRVRTYRVDGDGSRTHAATYEIRWPESVDEEKGDATHLMSTTTLYASHAAMHGTFDLMLMALTVKAIGDAFTEDHELYDQVFTDDAGEPRELQFTVSND